MEDQNATGGREEAAGPNCGAAAEKGGTLPAKPSSAGAHVVLKTCVGVTASLSPCVLR